MSIQNALELQTPLTEDELREPLTEEERLELAKLEGEIKKGLWCAFTIGAALCRVNEARLYRGNFRTFLDYCVSTWDISRSYAYQLMDASQAYVAIREVSDVLPQHEFQVRPLAKLLPDQQQKVWKKALKRANGSMVTNQIVQGIVDDMRTPKTPKSLPDAGTLDAVSADLKDALIFGRPDEQVPGLPSTHFDLVIISRLTGKSPETASKALDELLTLAAPVMKQDSQCFV